MAEKTQVNLWVGAAQKQKWDEYVAEKDRFASLSGLIRASVEAEIQDTESEQAEPSPALAQDIQTLHEEVSDVRTNVAWLREQLQDEVDVSDVAQDVFDALEPLPEPPEPVQVPDNVDMDYEEYQRHRRAQAVVDGDRGNVRSPQTASAIADRVGTTAKRVEDAVDHLEEQFLPVVTIEYNGEVHYFKAE